MLLVSVALVLVSLLIALLFAMLAELSYRVNGLIAAAGPQSVWFSIGITGPMRAS